MPPKRKRAAAKDKKAVSPSKKTEGEMAKDTPESSETADLGNQENKDDRWQVDARWPKGAVDLFIIFMDKLDGITDLKVKAQFKRIIRESMSEWQEGYRQVTEFDQHTSVAYSMMDEYPLDDDTDNDDSSDTSEGSVEKCENKQ